MPKDKQLSDSGSDSDSSGPADRNPPPAAAKSKKSKRESSDSEGERKKPQGKKAKTEGSSGGRKKNEQGDPIWELSKNKRVTVRTFKGKTYVDIREFYDAGGELKPGKKGISLQVPEYKKLLSILDEVTEAADE